MKFLILSDIHGDLEKLDALDARFKEADAVLFGGDYARFEHEETGKPVLDKLLSKHENIFSVIGNCDNPDFLSEIEHSDISVEGNLTFFEGIAIAGSGGGTKFTGTTPFERNEDEILSDYTVVETASAESADENGKWSNLILIMHNPPKDTECDKLPNGVHVGSEKLRSYIEKRAPFLVVTGHIHESAGISKIGKTTVINPGSLAEGKYGWVEAEKTADGDWNVTKAELLEM
ncbi:MAG: metallophosphoesterase family protein [Treponema sp.]|nr:metallophosphoesterase family protein [Treponema sp.]